MVVLAKIVALGAKSWKGKDLAIQLHLSASEVSESLHRSMVARLVNEAKNKVNATAFLEFLVHGLRYVYPATLGASRRGVPTAYSAPPLSAVVKSPQALVWASEAGTVSGETIEPLYPTVPKSAKEDGALHELLALIDAVRVGRAREANLAKDELAKRMDAYALLQP